MNQHLVYETANQTNSTPTTTTTTDQLNSIASTSFALTN